VAVIDVDTHLESGPELAAEFCAAVGASLSHGPELRAMMFAGELLRALPPDRRPTGEQLYPPVPDDEPWSVHRNVRATPLVSQGDDTVSLLAQIPQMLVFSTDFPHPEGNDVFYDPGLDAIDVELRTSFLGDNIAACFEHMGDPLMLPSSHTVFDH
jgi:hypothetical protein